jgi:hypothetical protein
MADNGISGTAVGAIGVGALLVYFGVQNIPLQSGLKDLLKGKFPAPGEQKRDSAAMGGFGRIGGKAAESGGSTGNNTGGSMGGKAGVFLNTVRAQIGKPYVWAAVGPNSFDCSGLVVFALRKAGLNVIRHTTWTFLVWNGATTVTTPAPGDLVCWTAHMGVYIGNGRMIHAPAPGQSVTEAPVTRGLGGPVYRRVKW